MCARSNKALDPSFRKFLKKSLLIFGAVIVFFLIWSFVWTTFFYIANHPKGNGITLTSAEIAQIENYLEKDTEKGGREFSTVRVLGVYPEESGESGDVAIYLYEKGVSYTYQYGRLYENGSGSGAITVKAKRKENGLNIMEVIRPADYMPYLDSLPRYVQNEIKKIDKDILCEMDEQLQVRVETYYGRKDVVPLLPPQKQTEK